MTLHGVDISRYQPDYAPTADVDFVFVKASEGHTYRNAHHPAQVVRARRQGCVVGHYHWLHKGNVHQQAEYFTASSGIQDGDLLACDWEDQSVPSSDDKDAFLKAVQRLRPKNRVLLYTYTSYWHSHNSSGYVADGLWIAHYGVPRPNINVPYRFWQYSDKPIDQNHGYFASVAALRAWASFAGSGVQPAQRPQVSLKAVQRALETATNPGKAGLGDNDGEQVQRALNHAMGAHLVVDGILGAQTRKVAAAFEVQAFGAKPGSKDADGILGKESLVRLGFDVQA